MNCFDFERERSERRKNKPFTLSRVQAAFEIFGHPEKNLNVIHIAGTKGKGSTLEYIHFGLKNCGVEKVGLFTSPHYISICERIRLDENNISYQDFKDLALRVTDLNQKRFDGDLSFFECLFLIAILYFKKEQVQQVILETGLGGRLDATNSIHSNLSVLTRIDYDHTEILGEQLHQIAREKAGIIKPHGVVIALKQEEDVNQIFSEVAKKQQAELHWVPLSTKPENVSRAQWENSLLAKAVVDVLFGSRSPAHSDYLNLKLKGRLQQLIHNGQEFLLDGAHNRISMRNLKDHLVSLQKPVQCAFAMGDSRSASELLQALDHPKIVEYCFFELPGGRPGLSPEKLLSEYKSMPERKKASVHPNIQQWCDTPFDGIKLVTGSIYLVGEVLKILKHS